MIEKMAEDGTFEKPTRKGSRVERASVSLSMSRVGLPAGCAAGTGRPGQVAGPAAGAGEGADVGAALEGGH